MSQHPKDPSRFAATTYDDFRRLARDEGLSKYERIGFPDEYRQGQEENIVSDLRRKLPALDGMGQTIIDIGCGCSDVPKFLAALAAKQRNELVLIDSPEMLAKLPPEVQCPRYAGQFPDIPEVTGRYLGRSHAVIVYSVVQYVFAGANLFNFLDAAVALLAPGGRLLIGDIPNVSKRRRFFSSEAGIEFHKRFMKTDQPPEVEPTRLEPGRIDDPIVMSMLHRYRAAGYETYLVPQDPGLPMANRREDVLIVRN